MTGFARREGIYAWGSLAWEIRSVNHRYQEMQIRLPEMLRHLETACRERLREGLGRGKIDCTLRLQTDLASAGQLSLNETLLRALADACGQADALCGGLSRPDALDLLRWPGVVSTEQPDLDELSRQTMADFERTLGELIAMRQREGEQLRSALEQRLDGIASIVGSLRKDSSSIVEMQRARLLERVSALGVDLDQGRLEQEVALLASRLDVAEELDRLDSHVAETRRVLLAGNSCGRRLDFLMQEFNREANTLCSKSGSSGTTQLAVDLKVLVEQMREQVQNIE